MKVYYKRKYPIGSFLNEDIGFEVEIDDETEIITTVKKLKGLCDDAHKELNPNMYVMGEVTYGEQQPTTVAEPIDQNTALIETLNYCTTLSMLEKFRPQVERKNNPAITQAFESKLKSLQ